MIRQAAIGCGGRGTRLGAVTADIPKPLLPIGEIAFLDVLVFELARHGIRHILLLAGFRADQIVAYAAMTPLKTRFGLEIVVSIEPQLLERVAAPANDGGEGRRDAGFATRPELLPQTGSNSSRVTEDRPPWARRPFAAVVRRSRQRTPRGQKAQAPTS